MSKKNDAYTAGLFDGEGTVTLMRTHKKRPRVPCVTMSSTSPALLDYLKIHYGGTIVKQKTYQSHHKTAWNWRLTNRKALDFLSQIVPHMLEPLKIQRAELLLSRYIAITPRNGKYSDEQLEAKSRLETEFFSLGLP